MSKVTVKIDSDEWYPVYYIKADSKWGENVEVDADVLARWEAAEAAFQTAQDEMGEACEAARAERVAKHGRRTYFDGRVYEGGKEIQF